jgi:hypothetical protein
MGIARTFDPICQNHTGRINLTYQRIAMTASVDESGRTCLSFPTVMAAGILLEEDPRV